MNDGIQRKDIETLIGLAISEDIGEGDITSRAIFREGDASKGVIVAKQQGIFCGGDIARIVYGIIDPAVSVTQLVRDGEAIAANDKVIAVDGPTVGILSGERITLNFIQRMTAIATRTASVVSMLRGTNIQLLDTRKTLPGFRRLDKYAVKTGGGTNHRMGLYDMVMIKDNHIRAAGSIARAVQLVRERYGTKYTVEVEAEDLGNVSEAVACGADIIMLDNMDTAMMKKAVELIGKRARIEVSGNMDEKRIKEIVGLDVDYISMGSLTHSVAAFDLSMDFD
ncbi:MAG TPA: carboxylating nicotinate-nucleotide diphosphorylase [Spirochaetota bacterium]|nr:carboxylating nicotinate-nucleotide diphosphorylase [Spirochaetota bacterium]HPC39438.1 carboxylating nicotinate-nucleotide diphosphorylase [Spirochaetota bacterium]HPL15898.1 carboxylating nicotinate-nucleotide diphosphorylase [Spirochaetota bacterium]HQF06775.1 carboxylating nicotinate-nucleotide diphosphorylase [Spirochaetota bacterium]HQH95606.1 carboxylating nicotinate-nucleotide diphosphorylase [Spirochaetota bacterium]